MLGGRTSTWDGPAGGGPHHQSLLGNCLYNLCTTVAACTDFFCCCWLIRGCFGGRIGPLSGPPPPPDPLLPPHPGHGGRRFEFPGEQQQQPIQFGAPFGQPGPAPAQFGPSPLL